MSNFYPVAFEGVSKFSNDRDIYYSAEQFFHAEKARFCRDECMCQAIMQTCDPLHAKKLGRRVQNFNATEWNRQRVSVMMRVLSAKFSVPEMASALKSTGSALLEEANPHDIFWGSGRSAYGECRNPHGKCGQNTLGKLLVACRSNILANEQREEARAKEIEVELEAVVGENADCESDAQEQRHTNEQHEVHVKDSNEDAISDTASVVSMASFASMRRTYDTPVSDCVSEPIVPGGTSDNIVLL